MKMLQIISIQLGFFKRSKILCSDRCTLSQVQVFVVDERVYKADDKIHVIFLHV